MRYITQLFSLLFATGMFAQTTALDFTALDCDGQEHHLFSDLEAGNAVVIDLVMMNCAPCVTATNAITNDIIPNVSDPTRVKIYSIGYTNTVTCTQMLNWHSTNGWDHEVFAGMSAQTTHYGGMGMPTIVVLGGGSSHGVYYNTMGYDNSHNADLIQAINDALEGSVGIYENNEPEVRVSPNPVSDVLGLGDARWIHASITDLQGRVVMKVPVLNGNLDVSTLNTGVYLLLLRDTKGQTGKARFEKY